MNAAQQQMALGILTREIDVRVRRAGERRHEAATNPHCEDYAALLEMEADALAATKTLVEHYRPVAP